MIIDQHSEIWCSISWYPELEMCQKYVVVFENYLLGQNTVRKAKNINNKKYKGLFKVSHYECFAVSDQKTRHPTLFLSSSLLSLRK